MPSVEEAEEIEERIKDLAKEAADLKSKNGSLQSSKHYTYT